MLEHLKVKGFRGLKDCTIDLPRGLPLVLIGENATGKSTILDAVAMICAVANGGVGRAILDRGGWEAVTWGGLGGEIEFVARFSADFDDVDAKGAPVEYAIRLGHARGIPTVIDEELRVYQQGLTAAPMLVLKGGSERWTTVTRTLHAVSAPTQPSNDPMGVRPVLAGVTDGTNFPTAFRVREALRSIAFYPAFALGAHAEGAVAEPLGSRQVEHVERIKPSGRDLVNALHTLFQNDQVWRALTTDLRAVFPWCTSINFPPGSGRGLITLRWVDSRSGSKLYLDDMSEGMRVYLALLAALHAPDQPALLAFDEPERSLHPHAIRRLVKAIESRAERTPIIVATHADRFLDYLENPAESLRITRFSKDAGVVVEKLDPELMASWLRDYSLSELRAKEILEAPTDEESES